MATLEYVDQLAAGRLECPICFEVYNDPVQVCVNEHHLCRACANDVAERRTCPTCNQSMSIADGQRFLKETMDELLVFCPNTSSGCQMTCTRAGLKAHQAACAYEIVQCQHCPVQMQRMLLDLTHFHCDGARFGCDFVGESDEMVTVHMLNCPVSKCRKQFEKYEREMADLRLSVVPKGVALPWSGFETEVPSGWALCDGKSGRPDLNKLFEQGAPAKKRRDDGERGVHYSFSYITQQELLDVQTPHEDASGSQDLDGQVD